MNVEGAVLSSPQDQREERIGRRGCDYIDMVKEWNMRATLSKRRISNQNAEEQTDSESCEDEWLVKKERTRSRV
jgi:hypothetical protein